MGTIFLTNYVFYLDNINIYFDNFFEVTYDIDKSMWLGYISLCILKMGYGPKTDEKL